MCKQYLLFCDSIFHFNHLNEILSQNNKYYALWPSYLFNLIKLQKAVSFRCMCTSHDWGDPKRTSSDTLVPFSFSSRASVTLWWRFSYKKQNINKVWIHTIVTTCTNSRYLQGTQSKGTLKNTMVLLQYATCQKHGGTMVFFDSEVNK